jgi:hypothetical protein
MAIILAALAFSASLLAKDYKLQKFGMKSDGMTMNITALQALIDKTSARSDTYHVIRPSRLFTVISQRILLQVQQALLRRNFVLAFRWHHGC